jgi:AAA+ ATPase superfamily predicted ATPase
VQFVNRTEELSLLRERLSSPTAELLIVYGRRRVGKTELLTHLASEARSLYFEATDTVALDQLRDLTAELARVGGSGVLEAQPLTSWEAALAAVAEFVGTQRTLVVFDEFQLLAAQSPELETVLSRWWRTSGRHLPLVLVLAGSELSFFEGEVLSGPLYGRRTGQMKLLPFTARDAALFHPGYDVDDRVRVYSICGGMPYYLERFPDRRTLHEHLRTEVFVRTGLLHEEAELMLRQSIADPTNHIAVLRAIAYGCNHHNEISQRTQIGPANVGKVLGSLERLGLVERLRPVTASPRSRKTAYAICDQFLRFHYRFVDPFRSQLRTAAMVDTYLSTTVLPRLDHHTSRAWEDICREHVLHTADDVTAVGRWWGQVPTSHGRRTEEREIDVVGIDGGRTPVAVGMCKWTTSQVDFDELNLLDRLTSHVEGHTGQEQRHLFSRSGFTDRLRAYAARDPRLHLVTPGDIYR